MPSISFEFFPPKTDEQRTQLDRAAAILKALAPEYVSVTFGAGGSTLSYTGETAQRLHEKHGLTELVRFIREYSGDHFHIEVAAYPETHPQADDAHADLRHFKAKIEAGANGAITQYFFNPDAYFRFVDDVQRLGVNVPIVPGIMPIANYSQLKRFSDMCGAEIPRWIAKRMQAHGDDAESIRALGAEVVAQLCRRLLDGGAPGLHFYTLNRAKATQGVLEQLR